MQVPQFNFFLAQRAMPHSHTIDMKPYEIANNHDGFSVLDICPLEIGLGV